MGSDIIFNVWQSNNASTHNYFLSILIYGGIVAIIVYLLLILLFYKKNKPYSDRRISQFLMLTLVIMNLEGIAENYGFKKDSLLLGIDRQMLGVYMNGKSMMSGEIMKLLVVMYGINGGGAEKSLVSFLTTLEMKYGNDIDVDLLLFRPEGLFLNQIPKNCNRLTKPKEVFMMSYSPSEKMFWSNISLKGIAGKDCALYTSYKEE